jgi:hypothetical protein
MSTSTKPLRLKKMKRRLATVLDMEDSYLKPDKVVDGFKFFGASKVRITSCFHCGNEATKKAVIHQQDAKGFPYTVIERYCNACLPFYIIPAK